MNKERIRREKNRKRKLKAALHKRKLKRRLNKPQFDLKLPNEEDELDSNYWIDSLSDGETVKRIPGQGGHPGGQRGGRSIGGGNESEGGGW